MIALLASLPSPSGAKLGPFNAYGLMIALGIMAAIWLLGRRLVAAQLGTPDDASYIGLVGAIGGVLGARLYHVFTSWDSKYSNPIEILKIWKGGLGIPGGIVGGIVLGVWAARRRGLPVAHVLTAAAPALPLGQAIGRWGNWFNQELYGRPTDLPWALEIDEQHLGGRYPAGTTFHPAFLYESLGNFAICGLLIVIGKRFRLKPGRLMAVYLLFYGVLRFFVESLRIDPTKEGGGLRLNQWMAIVLVAGSSLFLLWSRGRPAVAGVGHAMGDPASDSAVGAGVLDDDEADVVNGIGDGDSDGFAFDGGSSDGGSSDGGSSGGD